MKLYTHVGFPDGSVVKKCLPLTMKEIQVQSLAWEDPLEESMATHSSILSCQENSMDRGAWWAIVHRVTKSQARLSDFTFFVIGSEL